MIRPSTFADLVEDLVIDLGARKTRVILLVTAIAFATGALVTSVGVSDLAASQINADLAATTTNDFTVRNTGSATDSRSVPTPVEASFPANAVSRVRGLAGVRDAGLRLTMPDSFEVSRFALTDSVSAIEVDLYGATSDYLHAGGATANDLRLLDLRSPFAVAFVGESAAKSLGVAPNTTSTSGYVLRIGVGNYVVAGVIVSSNPKFSNSVVLPYAKAVAALGSDDQAVLFVHTAPGAGEPVAKVVSLALRPERPESLKVSTVVNFNSLRVGVSDQLSRFAAAIGALLLLLTVLLIVNSMVVSVVARTAEIGLRRALGASRGAIGGIFIVDGTFLGLVGGLAGSALGCVSMVVVAVLNGWTAKLGLNYVLIGPTIGMAVGLAGSLYPAWRASHISPAEAVRAE